MKFHILSFLALCSIPAQAFVHPSGRTTAAVNSPKYHQRNSLLVRYSTAPTKTKQWKDLPQFNMDLDKLAEQSGSFQYPVVSTAAQCEQLWQSVLDDASASIKPDTISFNTVLKAWSRCCNALSESTRHHKDLPQDLDNSVEIYTPRDAASHATSLLLNQEKNEDVPPDCASYNVVIDAWSKSRVPDAPEAAERLLRRMRDSGSIEPDTFTYHGVLDAWANSGREEALDKVQQIYHHMESLQKEGKDVNPTIRTVNAILNAYAKRASRLVPHLEGKDPVKLARYAGDAHKLLEDAKKKYADTGNWDWRPDITSYSSIMDVYARAGNYGATQMAEKLLREAKYMYAETKHPSMRPNFRTFTTLVTAWSRTRSGESPGRVEELLKEMALDPVTKPNHRTYTSAIQCWSRSRDHTKAKRCLKILQTMREEHKNTGDDDVRPTTLTYNAAIDACARCQGTMEQQTEALKIAFAFLKTISADSYARPNHITYAILLKAVANLLPAGGERNKVASAVFEKAKKGGLVEFATVKNLRKSVDAEVMLKLMDGNADQNGNFNYDDLPAAWSKNVQ